MGKKESNSVENKDPKSTNNWSVIALLTLAVVFALSYLIYINSKGWSWENAAQFGDMFGGVNAIFSGTAITAMALSIILQRRDLAAQREAIDLQRHEMELTRNELAKSADAHSATVENMNQQANIMKASACLPEIDRQLQEAYDRIYDPKQKQESSKNRAMNSILNAESNAAKAELKRIKFDISEVIAELENKVTSKQAELDFYKSQNDGELEHSIRSTFVDLMEYKDSLSLYSNIRELQTLRSEMFSLLTNIQEN